MLRKDFFSRKLSKFSIGYHMKRRDSLLPVIQKRLLRLKGTEEILLTEFVKKVGGILKK